MARGNVYGDETLDSCFWRGHRRCGSRSQPWKGFVWSSLGITRRTVLVAVLLVVWATMGLPGAVAAQDEGGPVNHAGLVVRHGDGRVTYAYVAFGEAALNGIELLKRSGIEAVTIPFGGLGEGVCSLEGEGCGVGECRRLCQTGGSDSPYWRYFGVDERGMWAPFELGASAATVRDGDVQLWAWSPNDPGIAPIGLADVAALAGAEDGETEGGRWVATVYPAGMGPDGEDGQSWLVYAAGGGVLVVIGAGVAFAVRRQRLDEGAESAEWDAA